jgi:hypothetical protein
MKAESLIANLKAQGWEHDPISNRCSLDQEQHLQFQNGVISYMDRFGAFETDFETWSLFMEWVNQCHNEVFIAGEE